MEVLYLRVYLRNGPTTVNFKLNSSD